MNFQQWSDIATQNLAVDMQAVNDVREEISSVQAGCFALRA